MISETTHQQQEEPALSSIGKIIAMVRKGGFEPPRLSAPPPQDGVSASSTTSAGCKLHALNNLAASESIWDCTEFCTDLLHSIYILRK